MASSGPIERDDRGRVVLDVSPRGSQRLRRIAISGFRSARETMLEPGPLCALVGEASVGKSNVLVAIWTLLRTQPALGRADAWRGAGAIRIAATLQGGEELSVESSPSGRVRRRGAVVPVALLPAALRTTTLVARPAATRLVGRIFRETLAGDGGSSAGAIALVSALEECRRRGVQGVVFLIEEPELFLRPQAQRYLYRVLRDLATHGNQVIYTTHSAAFLNVGRIEELAFVEHRGDEGTAIVQPSPLDADESFRAVSEFDAERGELFLSRAAMLVEGRTEKMVFPSIFRALGYDVDREGITIVECGGKPNIPLFARICEAAGVPYLVVHDRDAPAGKRPIQSEQFTNTAIAKIAGRYRTIVLTPDFEGVAGLRGHARKPERAWRKFAAVKAPHVPEPLAEAVRRTIELARD
jgi:putative ATP-dependent endonuclease of the OLD family